MDVTLKPARISGTIYAPASKSVMQRACAAALLRNGITVIHNYGISDDDKAALNIIQQLGAGVTYLNEHSLQITSSGLPKANVYAHIHCGESGLSLRMFTAIAALTAESITVEGHGSLLKRPVHFFETVLPQLQVTVTSHTGSLPMHIKGPLVPENIAMDGSITSQLLTGLLFAYAVAVKEPVDINVNNLKSKPYIDLTLKVMEDFGMNIPVNANYETFTFKPKTNNNEPKPLLDYTIEGDWSNTAFFMVAAAIAGSLTIKGLDVFTAQADKKILEALHDCGCRLSIQMDQIEITKHQLNAFHFDATDCPDLFPPLVALAAHCSGTSVIEGVHRLQHKESNRTESLIQEFSKLGISIQVQDDKMIIAKGKTVNEAVTLEGHNDHRIVMATAIASLTAPNEVTILGAEAVSKSFPQFFKTLEQISAEI
jgi:3-phosphoshikimate 1-carboxyvinyltransferase